MKKIINGITLILSFVLILSACKEDENNKQLDAKLFSDNICKNSYYYDDTSYCDTISQIIYSYTDSTQILKLFHKNTAFNCCPETLYCKVTINNDTLFVKELETSAACDCNCLYDVSIQISNISTKKYYIKVIEPYINNQTELKFEIDLTHNKSGSYSVVRKNYPWGTSITYY